MSITNSKVKGGTLTLGGVAFACQAKTVSIAPEYNEDGDTIETLCGDKLTPSTTRTDTLKITAVQDFDEPEGFFAYTWNHSLEEVAFTWKPNAGTLTFSGTVLVKALEIGGDVNVNLDGTAEWTIVGDTTVVGWSA